MPASVSSVFAVIAFIVPGFIASSMLSMFQPAKRYTAELAIVRFLTLSAYNYALWSWLVYLLIVNPWFKEHLVFAALLWGAIILIAPLLLGLFLGYESQREWGRSLFRRLGLRSIHIIPSAWDWRFGRLSDPHWVLVTLDDDSQVGGYFGRESFASSGPDSQDIYVEQIWDIPSDGGPWKMAERGTGMLIPGRIKSVEIRQIPDD